jgi:hypothetical protein
MCYNLTPFNLEITNMPALRSLKLFNELKNVGLPWDLTTLLNKAIRFKASEPRDRVYSLLGLAGEAEDASLLPTALQANYEKSVRDTFRDVTRYIITSSMNLSVLTLIRYIPNWRKYPSWVVDFSGDIHWERISYFAWKGACQRLRTRYPSIEALAHAFMVTLVANWSLTERELVAERPVSHFWAYIWRVYCKLYEETKSGEDRANIEKEYTNLLIMPNADETGHADLYGLHLDAAHNRRIFFTKDILYIGLGPSIMQESDTLCILFGGATPMILRPEGDYY